MTIQSELCLGLPTGFHPRRLIILLAAVLAAACSTPAGPEIAIDESGWEADTATIDDGGAMG